MRLIFGVTAVLGCGLMAMPAMAQDEMGAQSSKTGAAIQISHDVYSYRSAKIEVKPDGGSSTKFTESELTTFDNGWEINVQRDKLNFYAYPGMKSAAFLAGYDVTEPFEVGAGLSLDWSKRDKSAGSDKPEASRSSSMVIVYGTYYMPVSKAGELELGFELGFGSTKSEIKDSAGVKIKGNEKTTMGKLSAVWNHACLGNVYMYSGLEVEFATDKDTEADETTKTTAFSVTPLGLRYDI